MSAPIRSVDWHEPARLWASVADPIDPAIAAARPHMTWKAVRFAVHRQLDMAARLSDHGAMKHPTTLADGEYPFREDPYTLSDLAMSEAPPELAEFLVGTPRRPARKIRAGLSDRRHSRAAVHDLLAVGSRTAPAGPQGARRGARLAPAMPGRRSSWPSGSFREAGGAEPQPMTIPTRRALVTSSGLSARCHRPANGRRPHIGPSTAQRWRPAS